MKKKNLLVIITMFLMLAGMGQNVFAQEEPNVLPDNSMIKITSPNFPQEGKIPVKYTCDGSNYSPTLEISDVPENAGSLVLIVDDPDAPAGIWTHWIVYNISPSIRRIEENSVPEGASLGINSFNRENYGGPCPPSGTHRYYFKIYALDNSLNLPIGASRQEVEAAMEGHVVSYGELMGKYSREE